MSLEIPDQDGECLEPPRLIHGRRVLELSVRTDIRRLISRLRKSTDEPFDPEEHGFDLPFAPVRAAVRNLIYFCTRVLRDVVPFDRTNLLRFREKIYPDRPIWENTRKSYEEFMKALKDNRAAVFVRDKKGIAIGMFDIPEWRPYVEVGSICTHKRAQGHGHAKDMILHCSAEAEKRFSKTPLLMHTKNQKIASIARSLGWVEIGMMGEIELLEERLSNPVDPLIREKWIRFAKAREKKGWMVFIRS